MTTLAGFRTRIAQMLQDTSNTIWSTATLDEAMRHALADYSNAAPLTLETLITCPAAGREIALDSLTDLLTVTNVIWPYDSTASEVWPPSTVAGWRVFWDDARPVLLLNAFDGNQPQAGDEVRLWYTKPHTIQDLDSAAVTTPHAGHDSTLVLGAAGYAATMRAIDLTERYGARTVARTELEAWGARRLIEFRQKLLQVAVAAAPASDRYPQGWTLDKWDH